MANETNGYQGWKNYETWAAKLWMDNDEGSYNYWLNMAENNRDFSDLAEIMKQEHDDAMPELNGLWGALMTSAFSEIDWYEIANSVLEEIVNEDDDS